MNGLLSIANTEVQFNSTDFKLQNGNGDNTKSSFKDILSSKTEKDDNGPIYKQFPGASKKTGDELQSNDQVRHKVFRELEKTMRTEVKKSMLQSKKEVSITDENGNEASTDDLNSLEAQKADAVLNCLAQVLGIKPEDMSKLLDTAGIKMEELAGASAPEEISSKLSKVLGLNEGMENALTKIMQIINSQVDSAISEVAQLPEDSGAENTDMEKLMLKVKMQAGSGDDKEKVSFSLKVTGQDDLSIKIKAKLNELGAKLDENLVEKMSAELQPVLKKLQIFVKQKVALESAQEVTPVVVENAENTVKTVDESVLKVKAESDAETEDKAGKKAQKGVEVKDSGIQQSDSKTEAGDTIQQFSNTISQIQSKSQETADIQLKSHIPARDIINQVLEKAKVVLTGDKSEMILDLKPDSLGKISLKVVTESGIVMAKFVAESQQVKQILETNMQLLKDSLEKQGLNVQGFSVSVRQDSNHQSSNGYNGRNESGRGFETRQISGSNKIYGEVLESSVLQKKNPYIQDTGTINLTA